MARTVRDANLETRTGRSRLAPRPKPYFRIIEEGLHLGYRKTKSGTGNWCTRIYTGGAYKLSALGASDDFSDPDGVAILSYRQAIEAARTRFVSGAHVAAGVRAPISVADALDTYLKYLREHKSPRTALDATYRSNAFILPSLGKVAVIDLTTPQIRAWLSGLASSKPRVRTKKGKEQCFKLQTNTNAAEDLRRRKASANRTRTLLLGALNYAWRDGAVPSDIAWRKVQPYKGVDQARTRYLTVDEAKRLINAAQGKFRGLVHAALQTGARYGELTRLTVSDFNPDSGTLHVRMSKSGKGRHVVLTDEGRLFFARLAAGRDGDALLLPSHRGDAWGMSEARMPMIEACKAGRITPPITFHGLRHTYASLSVMAGAPLMVVAQNLGHADTRMVEKHYGHLAPSYVADAIRAHAPRFGEVTSTQIVVLKRGRRK